MFRLLSNTVFLGLLLIGASAFAKAPRPVLERFIQRTAKQGHLSEGDVRSKTIETLRRSLKFDRYQLDLIAAGRSGEMSERLQRSIVSHLANDIPYRLAVKLTSVKNDAMFSRYGERFDDIVARGYLDGLNSKSTKVRVQAAEAGGLFLLGKEMPELRNAIHETALMDRVPRVRLAALKAMRVHTSAEQRVVAEIALFDSSPQVQHIAQLILLAKFGSGEPDLAAVFSALQKIHSSRDPQQAEKGARELEAIKLRWPAG